MLFLNFIFPVHAKAEVCPETLKQSKAASSQLQRSPQSEQKLMATEQLWR